MQVVLRPDRGGVLDVEPGNDALQRGDAVALADPEHGDVEMGRPGGAGGKRVGDGAAGIVVTVEFDRAAGLGGDPLDGRVDLQRHGAAGGIGEPEAIEEAGRGERPKDRQQVTDRAAEGVLGREAQLHRRRAVPDLSGDGQRAADDLVDRQQVAGRAQDRRRSHHDADRPDAAAERDAGILGVTADMGDDPALEAEAGDRRAIGERPRADRGRGQLDIFDADRREQPRDLDLVGGREVAAGELFALAQRGVDDSKLGKGHVADVALPERRSGAPAIAHRLTNPQALYS